MNDSTKMQIENLINSHKIFLFMKGTPESPECGFSTRMVEILKKLNTDFTYINVFDNYEIFKAIKEYSSFITTPLLFIHGKIIGTCDTVERLYRKGRLKDLILK